MGVGVFQAAACKRFLERAQRGGAAAVDLASVLGNTTEIVETFGLAGASDLDAVVNDITDRSQEDASGRSGTIRFEVVAHVEGRVWGRYAFSYDAGQVEFGSESANATGLLVEAIRDKRESFRMALGHTEAMFQHFQTHLALMGRQIQDAAETQVKMFQLIADLSDKKAERDITLRKTALEAHMTERALESTIPAAMSLLSRAMAKDPKEPGPLLPETLMAFVSSLDETQILKFAEAMNPMQKTAFFMMLDEVTKAREAAEKAKEAVVKKLQEGDVTAGDKAPEGGGESGGEGSGA